MYTNLNGRRIGDRFVGGGGFLGPFILGGITGGLLAPAFYPRPQIVPMPMPFPQPLPPVPPYQPLPPYPIY